MNILILGGTGRTGKLLVQEALQRRHTVHALVRNRASLPGGLPQLKLFEGNPLDKETLRHAMQGCGAILSALNISRRSDFPWARLRTPEFFLSSVMKLLLELGPGAGISRIIVTSAWGANETKKDIPAWFRWIINHSNVGVAYRDHERQEDLLRAAAMDYTVVRPVGLTNSKKIKEVMVSLGNQPRPKLTISRGNTARFMIHVLEKDLYVRQMPVIFQN